MRAGAYKFASGNRRGIRTRDRRLRYIYDSGKNVTQNIRALTENYGVLDSKVISAHVPFLGTKQVTFPVVIRGCSRGRLENCTERFPAGSKRREGTSQIESDDSYPIKQDDRYRARSRNDLYLPLILHFEQLAKLLA